MTTLVINTVFCAARTRIEQANVHGLIGISRDTRAFINWDVGTFAILRQHGLDKIRYITIARGVDSKYNNSHPKLWPLAYYNNLISCIRKDYPDLAIVQVGASEQFGIFDDTDINLVGRTTLEETIVVLKYSLCHIDTEGGLVHIKRFLNGQSIVVFGPTLPSLYGYKENYNLRSDACPSSCEWVTRRWTEGCMRGYAVAPCMEAMAPASCLSNFRAVHVHRASDAVCCELSEK